MTDRPSFEASEVDHRYRLGAERWEPIGAIPANMPEPRPERFVDEAAKLSLVLNDLVGKIRGFLDDKAVRLPSGLRDALSEAEEAVAEYRNRRSGG